MRFTRKDDAVVTVVTDMGKFQLEIIPGKPMDEAELRSRGGRAVAAFFGDPPKAAESAVAAPNKRMSDEALTGTPLAPAKQASNDGFDEAGTEFC